MAQRILYVMNKALKVSGIINKKPIKKDTANNIQNKLEDCVEQSR